MTNRRILIVDDNVDIHLDFKKILQPKAVENSLAEMETALFGATSAALPAITYEIDSAYQGPQAVQMVEEAAAQGRPYALVFMDVRMPPAWDGIETTSRIWQKLPFTEVILCTAYSDYSSEDIIASLGVSHRLLILKKPYDAVAVKQLALAATTKWNLEAESRNSLEHLERAVQERTAELSRTVARLQRTNSELDESLKLNNETQQMLIQASKMSALGVMAGGVAHEINTPLATLILNVEMVEELVASGEMNLFAIEQINQVNKKVTDAIARIVYGLRKFCRDGSHDPSVPKSVGELIQETVALCEERMRNHDVRLELPAILTDLVVDCRAVEISQVLLNLLNNSFDAIHGTPNKWIRIGCDVVGGEVHLSVTDSGQGISKEIQHRIFEPFYTTKEVGKGTGLGLSISVGIVASHNGKLQYDSTSSNTKFVLSLPVTKAA